MKKRYYKTFSNGVKSICNCAVTVGPNKLKGNVTYKIQFNQKAPFPNPEQMQAELTQWQTEFIADFGRTIGRTITNVLPLTLPTE